MDSPNFTGTLKIVVLIIGFALVGLGFMQVYDAGNARKPVKIAPLDSTNVVKTDKDTIINGNKRPHVTIVLSTNVKVDGKQCASCKTISDDLIKAEYDNAFKYISIGIVLIFVIALLPTLKDFNLAGLFSVDFRDKIDAMQQLHNDAEQELASTPIEPHLKAAKLAITSKKPFSGWRTSIDEEDRRLIITVSSDLDQPAIFVIHLKVISINVNNPLKGKVSFKLPAVFLNPKPTIFVTQGSADLTMKSGVLFPVSAETSTGDILTFDLRTISGISDDQKLPA
jgi:hypothetical protein